jgi:hypothetical protein
MSSELDDEFAVVGRLLTVWTRVDRRNAQPEGAVVPIRQGFRAIAPRQIGPVLRHHEHMNDAGWLIGTPIAGSTRHFPVANISRSEENGRLRLTMRVALFHQARDGRVGILGWRFESPDLRTVQNPRPAHPYNHAQSIVGWMIDMRCLLHPHTASQGRRAACTDSGYNAVDEEKPAFPLRGESAPGLILAALVAMHGEPSVREMLTYDRTIRSTRFEKEFQSILGS